MNRKSMSIALAAASALLLALLAGCGHVAPTSPEGIASGGTGTADSTGGTTTGGPVPSVVLDPRILSDPDVLLQLGTPTYTVLETQVVSPAATTTVGGGRWALGFPAGSVTSAVTVTVATSNDGLMKAKFGPDGTVFRQPVDLTIDYAGTSLDPASGMYVRGTVPQFLYLDPARGVWVELACTNDAAHKQVRARLAHFSTYGLGSKAGW